MTDQEQRERDRRAACARYTDAEPGAATAFADGCAHARAEYRPAPRSYEQGLREAARLAREQCRFYRGPYTSPPANDDERQYRERQETAGRALIMHANDIEALAAAPPAAEPAPACCEMSRQGHHCDCKPCGKCAHLTAGLAPDPARDPMLDVCWCGGEPPCYRGTCPEAATAVAAADKRLAAPAPAQPERTTPSTPFFETVAELAAMRDKIPQERRDLSSTAKGARSVAAAQLERTAAEERADTVAWLVHEVRYGTLAVAVIAEEHVGAAERERARKAGGK